ncbi:hypothetical protein [Nocardiopsis sp. B62]|uniref:TPR repeat region-containing protein n=1 Tax=Nocardiopsis sp. B62 TaxID=2824874 RepID=UPI001B3704BB|nr:hypothetical protein [Nocardiopsis sp. B62]MBQ1081257.1 hypothetical protein [Nocardiopsis sp. B62]
MSLLNYTECEFDAGQIEKARNEFESLHAKIAGRSESYKSITSPVGDEFSDLIGDGLRQLATTNQSAWGSALLACLHGYGVLDKTVTDTNWYNEQIADIKSRLSMALNAIPPVEQDSFNRVDSTRRTFDAESRTLWTKFEARCEETEDTLKEGPTPLRIRQLAEGGHFGVNEQIGYQTTGDINFYVVETDYNTDVLTVHLFDAVIHGYDGSIQMLESDPKTLALLENMLLRAEQARESGEELSDRELAYLEAVYQTLGKDGRGQEPGLLWFMDQVAGSDHIDDDLRENIQRQLAGGMLVLSDEEVGGGMSRLPEDVRRTAVGPDRIEPSRDGDDPGIDLMGYSAWSDDWTKLSGFLNHADSDLQGGTEFSTNLLRTGSDMLLRSTVDGVPKVETFQDIIEVATRNKEANHIILTGEGSDGEAYPTHANHEHLTPERMLENLYTVPWPDEGEAVRGLTDWISADADSDSQEDRDRAGRSASALIEILTTTENEDGDNPFLDTAVGGKDYQPSVAEINPEVLKSLASVYGAYLDDISIDANERGYRAAAGGDDDEDDLHLFHRGGEMALHLPQEEHEKFLQLLLSNEEYSAPIVSLVEHQERRILNAYLDKDTLGDKVGGAGAADLRSAMSNALIAEYMDRHDDVETAREKANQMVQTGYNIVIASTVQSAGSKATPAGIAVETLLRLMEQPVKDYYNDKYEEGIGFTYIKDMDEHLLNNSSNIRDHANLQVLQSMWDRGMVDEETLEDKGLLIRHGDERRLPTSTVEWDSAATGYVSRVDALINEIDPEMGDRAATYIQHFQERYEQGAAPEWGGKKKH